MKINVSKIHSLSLEYKVSGITDIDLLSVNTYHISTTVCFKTLPFGLKLYLYNFE